MRNPGQNLIRMIFTDHCRCLAGQWSTLHSCRAKSLSLTYRWISSWLIYPKNSGDGISEGEHAHTRTNTHYKKMGKGRKCERSIESLRISTSRSIGNLRFMITDQYHEMKKLTETDRLVVKVLTLHGEREYAQLETVLLYHGLGELCCCHEWVNHRFTH